MQKSSFLTIIFLLSFQLFTFGNSSVKVGADNLGAILAKAHGKRIALVVNQTSRLSDGTFLVDALIANKLDIRKVFAPEHGFRGNADAGEKIQDGKDAKTGLELISLYGKNYKPSAEQLRDVDMVIYDIQDVGARFYTYISTLHYVMEACAQQGIQLLVLDRPNPNDVVDGPVLDLNFRSFVGMHPIPVLYGMTVGELALMINGEGWLENKIKCKLDVLPVSGWKHGEVYSLPVKPSPNLPNDQSIRLYPSLCFFEATQVSVGRGTAFPFQVVGYPDQRFGKFAFTPQALPGSDKNPLQKDKRCYGVDLRTKNESVGINLEWLIQFYKMSKLGASFFSSPSFMDKLAGSDVLRKQILEGKNAGQIRKSWQPALDKFQLTRKKYLLYEE